MTAQLYRCAGEHCPGLAWRASDHPHPASCVAEDAEALKQDAPATAPSARLGENPDSAWSAKAVRAGQLMAARLFKGRGRQVERHLSRLEIASLCGAAFELGAEHAAAKADEVLKPMGSQLAAFLKEAGGCDHSTNICFCDGDRALDDGARFVLFRGADNICAGCKVGNSADGEPFNHKCSGRAGTSFCSCRECRSDLPIFAFAEGA